MRCSIAVPRPPGAVPPLTLRTLCAAVPAPVQGAASPVPCGGSADADTTPGGTGAGATDERFMATRSQVAMHWLHRAAADPATTTLLEHSARVMPCPDGLRVSGWITGESQAVRGLRTCLRDERQLGPRSFAAVADWHRGPSESAFRERFNHDRDGDPRRVSPSIAIPSTQESRS